MSCLRRSVGTALLLLLAALLAVRAATAQDPGTPYPSTPYPSTPYPSGSYPETGYPARQYQTAQPPSAFGPPPYPQPGQFSQPVGPPAMQGYVPPSAPTVPGVQYGPRYQNAPAAPQPQRPPGMAPPGTPGNSARQNYAQQNYPPQDYRRQNQLPPNGSGQQWQAGSPAPGAGPQENAQPGSTPQRGTPRGAIPPGGWPSADPRLASRPVMPSPPQTFVFEPATVVARVGNLPILAGDLLGPINQLLEPYLGKVSDEQLAEQRARLMKRMLPATIETKMVYLDFLRTIPRENIPEIQKRLFDQFSETQLPHLIEKAGVKTPTELDTKLRTYGSSLYKTKLAFTEQIMAQQMVLRSLDMQPKISHEELRDYYQQHLDEYSTVAQARWEQLMVRFDRFPSRTAAEQALVDMGNEVLRGAPLSAVAREKSQGLSADQGGSHDWTTKGSLVSKPLDYNLFALPVGRLSQIIEDEQGLHIIRVTQRHEAAQVPFKTPPTVRLAGSSVRPHERNESDALLVARLENSGADDAPVETTVYLHDDVLANKKTVVPAYGSSEVRFELEGVDLSRIKSEDLKVDIEAQTRIRALIRQEKLKKQKDEYLARLRERTPVWTVFGELPPPGEDARKSSR